MLDIRKEVAESKKIAIAGHVRPDGDCAGSTLAMYLFLKKHFPEKEIDWYLESFSSAFYLLEGMDKAKEELADDVDYDTVILIDTSDIERIGVVKTAFEKAEKTIVIDHHISNNGFGTVSYVEPDASSASEMVFHILGKENLDLPMAEAVFLGIICDTGVLQYSNATKSTFEVTGALVEMGVRSSKIIDKIFYQKTFEQNQLLGRVLMQSQLMLDGKCIISAVSKAEMDEFGITSKDFEGIVSQLRNTKGVEVAILLYEMEDGVHKASFRSNEGCDVNKIAGAFGGGGHVKASGATITGPIWEVIARLMQEVEIGLKEFEGC